MSTTTLYLLNVSMAFSSLVCNIEFVVVGGGFYIADNVQIPF